MTYAWKPLVGVVHFVAALTPANNDGSAHGRRGRQTMKILQAGYPKSGNYWVYSLLLETLKRSGPPLNGYIKNHSIQQLAKNWMLGVPDQNLIDVVDIKNSLIMARISHFFYEPIKDINQYMKNVSIVWTHSAYNKGFADFANMFDKVIYIVRDPRDVAISMAHYTHSPYRKQFLLPDEATPEETLNRHFVRYISGWTYHVAKQLIGINDINVDVYFLFYERLKENFEEEYDTLLSFLAIDLPESARWEVSQAVRADQMRKKAPGHVRQAKASQWGDVLNRRQKQYARLIAGPLLKLLHYPDVPSATTMPFLPKKIPSAPLRRALRRAYIARGLYLLSEEL
ncbi:MAG: hypothetical protein D6694_11385 [Gammaproteobacteria bacterium]|nr:MAG: hypothetical protein D6694_11385 [Gammaproteobacteria bacterium]